MLSSLLSPPANLCRQHAPEAGNYTALQLFLRNRRRLLQGRNPVRTGMTARPSQLPIAVEASIAPEKILGERHRGSRQMEVQNKS